ncbi:imidazolonepropionase [Trebonia kvetii]|uniref:Imidazolonepropionase n=1 Tax=Trebonia kvetii TaxID=2480626 RepID=A0A6P2BYV3_9ACTN|nr:imidazolonepropionase [Trebonia kvetii]TVZ04108.1 imidazolonepropionase [Trebonia kvetii]
MPRSLLITRIGELVTNTPDGTVPASAEPTGVAPANTAKPAGTAQPGGTAQPSGPGGSFAAIGDAALVIEDGWIAWTGPAAQAPAADEVVDAAGRAVLPGFADSHAHLVFAGERSAEFAARMAGRKYTAGGIRTTVAATRAASDAELRAGLGRLAGEMLAQGSTTFECKSGYGLTVPDEARAVALAAEITGEVTYLGAHVVPAEFAGDPGGYVDLVCGPMLDACAPHCRWADVFCERGAFGADEARAVLTAGLGRGLLPRIHASQLGPGPGIVLAVEIGAASADHCTFLTDADVDALASSDTVATLLPGAEFSTRQPYPDARRLLDAGATVALATDCNPGTSYTTSMPFCIALAVRDMRMTTEEAVWSATAGGARALRRTDIGYLAPGARADLIILDAPSHAHLAYRPGVPLIHAVYKSGRRVG